MGLEMLSNSELGERVRSSPLYSILLEMERKSKVAKPSDSAAGQHYHVRAPDI